MKAKKTWGKALREDMMTYELIVDRTLDRVEYLTRIHVLSPSSWNFSLC